MAAVGDRLIPRGRRFEHRGRVVGWELAAAGLPAVPNPPPAPLEPFELLPDVG